MMKIAIVTLALLLPLPIAFAGENALFRHSDSCLKYPPSDVRTQCLAKECESAAAIKREQLREESASKGTYSASAEKNDLCFTRKASGEVICPN